MSKKYLLGNGNSKMGKSAFHFSLPPIKTCSPSEWCLHGKNNSPACYALRNRFTWDAVKNSLENSYIISKQDNFSDLVIDEINKREIEYLRIHHSGDFYSEDYIEKWIEITSNCKDTLFRASTRRRDFTSLLQELNSFPNVVIRESLDSSEKIPRMNLPVSAVEDCLPISGIDNFYHCINDCQGCKYHCWESKVNTSFKFH